MYITLNFRTAIDYRVLNKKSMQKHFVLCNPLLMYVRYMRVTIYIEIIGADFPAILKRALFMVIRCLACVIMHKVLM